MTQHHRHPMSLELLRQEARDELAAVIEFRCRLGDDPWDFLPDLPTVDEQVVLTLREETGSNGFVNGHPMAHHRWVHNIDGPGDAYAELISSGGASFEGGPVWTGDVDVRLFDSPTEELADLTVDEVIGGYYRQVGVIWNGGATLARQQPDGSWA